MSPFWLDSGRAVAYFQPVGRRRLAATLTVSAVRPCGYKTSEVQAMSARLSVVVAWAGSEAVSRSNAACTLRAPPGTLRWNAYISTRSRFHTRVCPPAVKTTPDKLAIGPFGACSPGSHLGYTKVSAPACAGISIWTWRMWRAASVASTAKVIVGFCADGTGLSGGAAWASAGNTREKARGKSAGRAVKRGMKQVLCR